MPNLVVTPNDFSRISKVVRKVEGQRPTSQKRQPQIVPNLYVELTEDVNTSALSTATILEGEYFPDFMLFFWSTTSGEVDIKNETGVTLKDGYRTVAHWESQSGYYVITDKPRKIAASFRCNGGVSGIPGPGSTAVLPLAYKTTTNDPSGNLTLASNAVTFTTGGNYLSSIQCHFGLNGVTTGAGDRVFLLLEKNISSTWTTVKQYNTWCAPHNNWEHTLAATEIFSFAGGGEYRWTVTITTGGGNTVDVLHFTPQQTQWDLVEL